MLAACTPPPPPGPYGTAPSYVAMAPAIQDTNVKQFAAPPVGMGALYLLNPTTAAPVLNVVVNGREIGRLGTQTWMRAEFAPGEKTVRCIGGDSSGAYTVYLAPGEIRYLEIAMSPGQMVCSVREVPPEEGRSAVLMGGRALQRQ
jgi:hypothetical protein